MQNTRKMKAVQSLEYEMVRVIIGGFDKIWTVHIHLTHT